MSDDEPTGRDVRMVWKTIAVVGGVIAACLGLAVTVIVWGTSLETRFTANSLKIEQLEKQVDKLNRSWDWHNRGHAPGSRQ